MVNASALLPVLVKLRFPVICPPKPCALPEIEVQLVCVAELLVTMPPLPARRSFWLLPTVPVIWLVPLKSIVDPGALTPIAVVPGAPAVTSSGKVLSPPFSTSLPRLIWVWPV